MKLRHMESKYRLRGQTGKVRIRLEHLCVYKCVCVMIKVAPHLMGLGDGKAIAIA